MRDDALLARLTVYGFLSATIDKRRRLASRRCQIRLKKMKTKWGSFNENRISITLELEKKPLPFCEYAVFDQLIHLLDRQSDEPSRAFADGYMPSRTSLKTSQLQKESWSR